MAYPLEAPEKQPMLSQLQNLPRTAYIYLALLIFSFIAPLAIRAVVPKSLSHQQATAEGKLSQQDFERYMSAETSVRMGIGQIRALSATGKMPNTKVLGRALDKLKANPLADAEADYRALSTATHVPNMDRRVLILDHALGRPWDGVFVKQHLVPNLRLAKTSAAETSAELLLWHALYADRHLAPASVPAAEQRIRGMNLKFLQDRALADLYTAAGQTALRDRAEARLTAVADGATARQLASGIFLLIGFLVGFTFLLLFLIAAGTRNWAAIGRVETAALRLGWGDLLDGFLFYLAFYRCLGLLTGLLLSATDWSPPVHSYLLLEAGLQIGTGIVALAYLWKKARGRETTLADIGLTTRRTIVADIGYGILGFLAGLPIIMIMGLISHAIFRHNTATTPNPVLPLMVGTHDPLSRILIFLMASVAAPFFEEIFFRGVLFTGLRTRYGWTVSALLSATCFALVHPMQDWLPIFALGFTFATMREMRQSLVPSMTAHFLQNTMSFVFITSLFSS